MRIVTALLVTVTVMAQAAVLPSFGGTGNQSQGIQWATGFDEALSRARAENKPVFLDFFNPN
jgi:hypothetical protein